MPSPVSVDAARARPRPPAKEGRRKMMSTPSSDIEDVNIVGTRAWREDQHARKRRCQWIRIACIGLASTLCMAFGIVCVAAIRHTVLPIPGRPASDTCVLPNDRKQRAIPGDDYRCNPAYTTYTSVGVTLAVVGGIVLLVAGLVAFGKWRDEKKYGTGPR